MDIVIIIILSVVNAVKLGYNLYMATKQNTVTQEIQQIYDEITDYVEEDTDFTEDYMNRINKHFYAYLHNPSDKQEETFKRIRDALIVLWLADLLKKLSKQVMAQWKVGISTAKTALNNAQIKSVIKKAITSDKIKDLIQANLDKSMTEITYISNSIKVNSDRAIRDIKSNIDKTKKAISTELMAEFNEYGISYFIDSVGRRQSITNYVKMKSTDMAINSFRDAYIAELARNSVEYGIVRRLPSSAIECSNCIPFDNRILAFSENDKGFMTVAEARSYNLFHYFCFHYLEPVAEPDESKKEIILSEENKKSKARNDKKDKKFGLLS